MCNKHKTWKIALNNWVNLMKPAKSLSRLNFTPKSKDIKLIITAYLNCDNIFMTINHDQNLHLDIYSSIRLCWSKKYFKCITKVTVMKIGITYWNYKNWSH